MADELLTLEEQASERVGLEVALRGVREGLTFLPARSPWVRCFREIRDGLGARVGELSEPARRELPGRDDLAA